MRDDIMYHNSAKDNSECLLNQTYNTVGRKILKCQVIKFHTVLQRKIN